MLKPVYFAATEPVNCTSNTMPTTGCISCNAQELCLPAGLAYVEKRSLSALGMTRRRVAKDTILVRAGENFASLYAVHCGHFKTFHIDHSGAQQVTRFSMAGDLVGLSAINAGRHAYAVVALEDSVVCDVPFAALQSLMTTTPDLLKHFHRTLSREITHDQKMMVLLGGMRAEQRLATFLLDLSERYAARGYAAHTFNLKMAREDIANYLGLAMESVSRLMNRFSKSGIAQIERRAVTIHDVAMLREIAIGKQTVLGML